MSTMDLRTLILPRLLTGARDGLPLDRIGATSPLQALALAGQSLRFDPPARPAQFHVDDPIQDERRIIPDPARKLLLRLFAAKGPSSHALARAVARTMEARRLRPHPFDLPKLESFVKIHAEALGEQAMAFSQREAPAGEKQNYFAADRLNDENWMLATPAVKANFIADRRHADPAAALALMEASWGAESADSRLRLLGMLRVGLSEADKPFLESLGKDRAPRVREMAHRMLARLPNYAGDDPALRAAFDRIKAAKSGLIFKKTALALEIPANINQYQRHGWIRTTFAGVEFAALGRALSLTPDEVVEAARNDGGLLFACFVMATEEADLDLLIRIVARIGDVWTNATGSGLDELPGYDLAQRQRWADIVVQPRNWTETHSFWSLASLIGLVEGPVSERLMREILGSKPWKLLRVDQARFGAEVVENMAALCPPAVRMPLRHEIADLDATKTHFAHLFLDLMDAMEANNA